MRYSLFGLALLLSVSCFGRSWDLRGDHHYIEVPNDRDVVLYNGVACYRDTFEPVEAVKQPAPAAVNRPEPVAKAEAPVCKTGKCLGAPAGFYTLVFNGKSYCVPNGKALMVLDGALLDVETRKPFVEDKPAPTVRVLLPEAFDFKSEEPTPVSVKREIVIDAIPEAKPIEIDFSKSHVKLVQEKPKPPPDPRLEIAVSGKLIYVSDKHRYAISDGRYIVAWITENAPDMKAQVDTQVTISGHKVEDWNGGSCLEPIGVPVPRPLGFEERRVNTITFG